MIAGRDTTANVSCPIEIITELTVSYLGFELVSVSSLSPSRDPTESL
jgi:hypothetical protein